MLRGGALLRAMRLVIEFHFDFLIIFAAIIFGRFMFRGSNYSALLVSWDFFLDLWERFKWRLGGGRVHGRNRRLAAWWAWPFYKRLPPAFLLIRAIVLLLPCSGASSTTTLPLLQGIKILFLLLSDSLVFHRIFPKAFSFPVKAMAEAAADTRANPARKQKAQD